MQGIKSQPISKEMIKIAYEGVRKRKGGAGFDGMSLDDLETDLENHLYKLWNRMSSGSYFPPPVLAVEIPKDSGGVRTLGIPTVLDRIAQRVVKDYLEPLVEPHFHESSYAYRPGRSQQGALRAMEANCRRYAWLLDLDLKGFFDHLDHELLLQALGRHTDAKWVKMYIARWLKAPLIRSSWELELRDKGSPQGGVVSPLLSNLYLHYGFDKWMDLAHPGVRFERFADDIIVHCRSKEEADRLYSSIRERLQSCRLELNESKSRIVYCKDSNRKGRHTHESVTFLGKTFAPRKLKGKKGGFYTLFKPRMSKRSRKRFTKKLTKVNISRRTGWTIEQLAEKLNPIIQGTMNYFGGVPWKSGMQDILWNVNRKLIKWALRKYKRFKRSVRKAVAWLRRVYKQNPELFVHWAAGVKP